MLGVEKRSSNGGRRRLPPGEWEKARAKRDREYIAALASVGDVPVWAATGIILEAQARCQSGAGRNDQDAPGLRGAVARAVNCSPAKPITSRMHLARVLLKASGQLEIELPLPADRAPAPLDAAR
jgi:hypothetical protein